METWVIFQSPAVLLLAGIAVLLNRFDMFYKSSKGFLTIISAVLGLIAAAWLFFSGAGLRELAALLTVFMLLNIGESK